jgi:thiamine pyrophosphate-dependent acetolactate synthase large subunit-like protein
VQIDIDGRYAGMRYPDEVNLVGDAAATLRALLPRLRRRATAPGANRWKRTWPAGGRL